MKKLIALALALALVLALAACAKEPETTLPAPAPTGEPTDPTVPQEPGPTYPNNYFDPALCGEVIGSWKTPVVLDGNLMNMPEFEGSVSFDLLLTFQNSGRYTISADEAAATAAIAEYESLLSAYMLEGYYSRFAAEQRLEGLSDEQIDEAWTATQQALSQAQVDGFIAALQLSAYFESIMALGDYYVIDGTLCISTGTVYEAFSFLPQNGLLYFLACSDQAKYEGLGLTFPLPLWPTNIRYEDKPAEDLELGDGATHPTVTVPPMLLDPDATEPSVNPGIPSIPGMTPVETTPGSSTIPNLPPIEETEVTTPETLPVVPVDPTQPPVTQPPVSDPPATQPPATEPPVTKPQPPVTQPPVTEPPATLPPVSDPPSTEPPATEPPASDPSEETEATDPTIPWYPTDPDDGPPDFDVDWAIP